MRTLIILSNEAIETIVRDGGMAINGSDGGTVVIMTEACYEAYKKGLH